MEDRVYLSILFDFYGELLDGHKKQIFEEYMMNDLSLGEIAEEAGISRQGIHDIVRRCSRKLFEYEECLHLVHKFGQVKKNIEEIRQLLEQMKITKDLETTGQIEQKALEILDIL